MRFPWTLLKYLPPGLLRTAKRHTSSRFRFWLREHAGGSYKAIPDAIVSVADGRQFHIGSDVIYWPLHMGVEFEPEATSIVRRVVRPGDVVIDVGANFGWYTTLLAELVGDSGHVYSFEPVPAAHDRLLENLRLNRCDRRVSVIRSAVGNEVGQATIHVFSGLSHAYSSLSRLDHDDFEIFATPITTIDAFLATEGVEKVDFVKCDVEGSELLVLKGSQRALQAPGAPILMVELNELTSAAFGYSPRDIWTCVRDAGYDHCYAIESIGTIQLMDGPDALKGHELLLCGKGDRISGRMAQIAARPT